MLVFFAATTILEALADSGAAYRADSGLNRRDRDKPRSQRFDVMPGIWPIHGKNSEEDVACQVEFETSEGHDGVGVGGGGHQVVFFG